VATSTVRFAIILTLVVVGAILIAQFPQGATSAGPGSSPTPAGSRTGGSNGGSKGGGQGNNNGGGSQQTPAPTATGIKVAVYNGTTQTGLAADVAAVLVKKLGVKVNPQTSILNAPSIPVDMTTVYYVSATDKVAASALADVLSKKLTTPAKVQKLPVNATVPAGVQVAVYLGTDYVNGG
jgi:LytR cell envelope-related transcriptional attenuator